MCHLIFKKWNTSQHIAVKSNILQLHTATQIKTTNLTLSKRKGCLRIHIQYDSMNIKCKNVKMKQYIV